MATSETTYDIRVRIEGTDDLYVSEESRAQMQNDAQNQLADHIGRGQELFEADDFDASDLEKCKELATQLNYAYESARALVALSPLPDDFGTRRTAGTDDGV